MAGEVASAPGQRVEESSDRGGMYTYLVAQSCPTLCSSMDCNPPGSSVRRISQARILEWVAIPFSRGSFQPRDQTQISCMAVRFFTACTTREAHWGRTVIGLLKEAGPEQFITSCWKERYEKKSRNSGVIPINLFKN